MPWSYKRAKHDACGGQGCPGCDKGKVNQSLRTYPFSCAPQSP